MIPEQAGVKYGLQIKAKPGQLKLRSEAKVKEKSSHPTLSVFADDDVDDDVEAEIERQALKKRSQRQVEQAHEAALGQDASVFDYDGVYDEMKGAKQHAKVDSEQRKSKYIGHLMKKAEAREKEQEIVKERLLSKERAKEDHLFGEKEKFVTRAYREKLAERAKWLEEEKRKDALEMANDVTKREDLSDFYRNLMRNSGTGARLGDPGEPEASPAQGRTTSPVSARAAVPQASTELPGRTQAANRGGLERDASSDNAEARSDILEGTAAPSHDGSLRGGPVDEARDAGPADAAGLSSSTGGLRDTAWTREGAVSTETVGAVSTETGREGAQGAALAHDSRLDSGETLSGVLGKRAAGGVQGAAGGGAKRRPEPAAGDKVSAEIKAAAARERYLARKKLRA
eukprot:TRINITY_DN30020_c0_g1_i1.p1 TRINITY_DN30020_c0_g1~~TRINITY_DN30020_c0_g1_i1.p1  ORF type:complete len:400 (+),score=95.63 TRINITY_DN30020_c0_g1_i1:147-1346(+)